MKPFLKWAGNKYSLREEIAKRLGEGTFYVEPFLGAGSIFAAVADPTQDNTYKEYRSHWLNDRNQDLIAVYEQIAKVTSTYIANTYQLFKNNSEADYYKYRSLFNEGKAHNRTAFFLYLNRHGFNGLCRYNQGGFFNVPWGKYKKPYFPQKEIEAWGSLLRKKQPYLSSDDFEVVMDSAPKWSVIYCDPPYFPISLSSDFTAYTNGWKTGADDIRLAEACFRAKARGCKVLVSNSDTFFVREIYKGAQCIEEITARRSISAKAQTRGKVTELLITV